MRLRILLASEILIIREIDNRFPELFNVDGARTIRVSSRAYSPANQSEELIGLLGSNPRSNRLHFLAILSFLVQHECYGPSINPAAFGSPLRPDSAAARFDSRPGGGRFPSRAQPVRRAVSSRDIGHNELDRGAGNRECSRVSSHP